MAYSLYCARYKDISYEDFMQLGFFETKKKISSVPEDEPLYIVFKARSINLNTIKNKEEKAYWQELKRINEIPEIYLSDKQINDRINELLKKGVSKWN